VKAQVTIGDFGSSLLLCLSPLRLLSFQKSLVCLSTSLWVGTYDHLFYCWWFYCGPNAVIGARLWVIVSFPTRNVIRALVQVTIGDFEFPLLLCLHEITGNHWGLRISSLLLWICGLTLTIDKFLEIWLHSTLDLPFTSKNIAV
jgi:hypothetical protein